MPITFTDANIAKASAFAAGLDNDRIEQMYIEGLLERAGHDLAGHRGASAHERTDTCRCPGCFAVMFAIVQAEYRHRTRQHQGRWATEEH